MAPERSADEGRRPRVFERAGVCPACGHVLGLSSDASGERVRSHATPDGKPCPGGRREG